MPADQLRGVAQSNEDAVIKLLHPYYSGEFEYCAGSADKRLEALFGIKDKWT
jgi:hypothetical protein